MSSRYRTQQEGDIERTYATTVNRKNRDPRAFFKTRWGGTWPLHEFPEILLEIRYLSQIGLSGNFRGKKEAPAEPLSGKSRNTWSSLRKLPTVASQRAAGEKNSPPNSQIMSKSEIFRVPLRFLGSDTEKGIEIF